MIQKLLEKTAWPMFPPAPWSAFHIAISLTGISFAVVFTCLICQDSTVAFSDTSIRRHTLVLWICGVFLAVSELYKQLFLFQIVNHGHYDWWYFPFQLCSTPMYLCLVFPWLFSERLKTAIATYLKSFGFLGGTMALAEPSGLMHSYWSLTLHGFLWHILLIFIALFCACSDLTKEKNSRFSDALTLFFGFCLIAMMINILTGGKSDMFYISPYYPVTQAVFYQISMVCGIIPGIIVYLLSVCAGAYLCHKFLNWFSKISFFQ